MPVTKIQTIIDKQGNTILPRTRVEAITLSDGTTKLEDQLLTLEDGVISNPLPVDADTLNGELPSYYATASNLTNGLALKANVADAALTGVPTAPTAPVGTNTSQVATTAYVRTEIAAIVDAAPSTLDTLNELAAALGDDPNFATTITTALSSKAPLESPTFTGTVSGITKAMVGLGNVDNTSDANKPISTATQTALNGKLSLTGGTLTGALNGTTITTSGEIKGNQISIVDNQINRYDYNGTAPISINYTGYNGGTTQFRGLSIYDGKQNSIADFSGIDKSLTLQGNLIMANGKGIDFSASQSGGATSSLLDDYEEGTWTPTISNITNLPNITVSQKYSYTKIGNVVIINAYFNCSSVGANAKFTFTLPFNVKSNIYGVSLFGFGYPYDVFWKGSSGIGLTEMIVFASATSGNAQDINISFSYLTNS